MFNLQSKSKLQFLAASTLVSFTFLMFPSCGEGDKKIPDAEEKSESKKINPNILDSASALNATIGGKMFSLPSPIETMDLIKKAGKPYNANLINNVDKVDQYVSSFQKSLAVGVYGADLGYAAMFQQNNTCIDIFKAVDQLTKELGLSAAFNKDLINEFIENSHDQKKLLQLITRAYRNADNFLKDNKQTDIASLIIAGGWIESMYFATTFAKMSDESLRLRIGEQKKSLTSLIGLLKENQRQQGEEYDKLLTQLRELETIFKDVHINYSFAKPEVIPAKKLTIIKSETSYNISVETLEKIDQKINEIRNSIVN